MIKNGIDLREQLFQGAEKGIIPWIEAALAGGMSIDAGDILNATALHIAALYSQADAVKWLLEAGADVDALNKNHNTPLHYAANTNQTDSAKMLLAAGADLAAQDTLSLTPIDIAWNSGNLKLAAYLQSILDNPAQRPTPEDVGLDMNKRIAALEALGKPLGQFTEQERKRTKQRDTREAQRQAALRGEGI